MAKNQLKLVGVQLGRPLPSNLAASDSAAWLNVVVEVENTGTKPLHVWASHRAYDYDPSSHVLTVHLTETALALPPNIVLISDHPRVPDQIELAANSRAKIRVRLPPFVRRSSPDGKGWFEDPIGDVAKVDIGVQYANTPFESPHPGEFTAAYRARMQAHGDVTQARITPQTAP